MAWLSWIVAICGCVLALPAAFGQPPPRVQFGAVVAVDDKPAEKKPAPDKDTKKKPEAKAKDTGVLLYAMPVTPPSAALLFRLDSEETFRDRLRTEVRERFPKVKLEFPESEPPAVVPRPQRDWPEHVKLVEPGYVISKRLHFEQTRFERYGHNLGVLQPAVATGIFGIDLVLWPARRMVQPFRCYQINTDCYSPYFQLVGE